MNTKYPEYIRSFRPKGTVVRLRNGRYLVFRATSKHVPGKRYPVTVIGDMVGWIDSNGFHPQNTRTVDFSSSKVFEYGFTALLLTKEDTFLARRKADGIAKRDADRVERFIKENNYHIKLKYGAYPDRPYDSKAVWGNANKISKILSKRK